MGAIAGAWHGASKIVTPVLFLVGAVVFFRALAWVVKARRGY